MVEPGTPCRPVLDHDVGGALGGRHPQKAKRLGLGLSGSAGGAKPLHPSPDLVEASSGEAVELDGLLVEICGRLDPDVSRCKLLRDGLELGEEVLECPAVLCSDHRASSPAGSS